MNNQRGTTLVETLVGLAILTIAIAAGTLYMSNVQNARNIRKLQTNFRFLAIQATLEATNNYPFYPPVEPPDAVTQPLYVACFTSKGDKVQNETVTHGRDFQFFLAQNYNENLPSGACSKDKASFEVRFFWLSPYQSDININILNLRAKVDEGPFRLFRNFKIFAK